MKHRQLQLTKIVERFAGKTNIPENRDAVDRAQRAHKFRFRLSFEAWDVAEDYALDLLRNDLLSAPFDECYFEIDFGIDRFAGIVLWTDAQGDAWVRVYGVMPNDRFSYHQMTGHLTSLRVIPDAGHPNPSEEELYNFAVASKYVIGCIGALQLRGVSSDVVEASALTNKIRKDKGKLPLYSYNIIRVKSDPSPIGTPRGGLSERRASPRLHWRQGHVRTLHKDTANERKIKIPPMRVGNEEQGTVDSDYEVT